MPNLTGIASIHNSKYEMIHFWKLNILCGEKIWQQKQTIVREKTQKEAPFHFPASNRRFLQKICWLMCGFSLF